jgi:hypothetical protein
MTAESRDLRASISVVADQTLAAVAEARDSTKQQLVREVLDAWAAKVLHESTLVLRFQPGNGKPRSTPE